MDEYVSIFVESSEELGVMIDSYKPVLKYVNSFMDKIESCIKDLRDPDENDPKDLSNEIKDFKEKISVNKTPKPVSLSKIKDHLNTVKNFRDSVDGALTRYAKLKKDVTYGNSPLIMMIFRKPKVYTKDANGDRYEKVQDSVRSLNRALDWTEKCLIDLFNFVDQDLDLLTILDRVYAKNHIYEGAELPGGLVEDVADSVIGMLPNATEAALFTHDKKTGRAPGYLYNNHDMARYGEDDEKEPEEEDDQKKALDDYERPSATNDGSSNDEEPVYRDDKPVEDDSKDSVKKDSSDDDEPRAKGVQNYYYYTYNNSLNKNSNSFNRDSSSHDDHSTHNKRDDHSVHITQNRVDDKKDNDFRTLESVWSLNVPMFNTAFIESATDINPVTDEGKRELEIAKKRIENGEYKGTLEEFYSKLPEEVIVHIVNDPSKDWKDQDHIDAVFKVNPNRKYLTNGNDTISSANEFPIAVCNLIKSLEPGTNVFPNTAIVSCMNYDITYFRNNTDIEGIEDDLLSNYRKFNYQPHRLWLNNNGGIGFEFKNSIDSEHGLGILFPDPKSAGPGTLDVNGTKVVMGPSDVAFDIVQYFPITEEVGDADANKPESDHPVKDIMMDIDRTTTKVQQGAKKVVQDVQNVGRAAMKPVNRTKQWLGKMITDWRDKNETDVKERMADPHSRSALLGAFKKAVAIGALWQAGLLLNPIVLGIGAFQLGTKKSRDMRIRNEMIGELKAEMEVIDEKIKDADRNGDNKAKYQLMRFKNEVNKKLLRVGGGKSWKNII